MGVSLSLVFHVGSAIGIVLLAGWALRLQRDLRFLRKLLKGARSSDSKAGPNFRAVDVPGRFVARVARAFGVVISGAAGSGEVSVINAGPLIHLFLRNEISLIQFSGPGTIEIHFSRSLSTIEDDLEKELAAACNGAVRFKLCVAGDHDHAP